MDTSTFGRASLFNMERFRNKMSLTKKLQEVSAKCVKQVEVIRAQRLLNGRATTSGYFENIEHCINEEFGRWQIGKMTNYY